MSTPIPVPPGFEMKYPPSLLKPQAEVLKDAGMKKVWDGTTESWQEAVLQSVRAVALIFQFFTIEHVRVECANRGIGEPHHRNAWGSLLPIAARRGYCKPTKEYMKGTRPESHGRALQVWSAP